MMLNSFPTAFEQQMSRKWVKIDWIVIKVVIIIALSVGMREGEEIARQFWVPPIDAGDVVAGDVVAEGCVGGGLG